MERLPIKGKILDGLESLVTSTEDMSTLLDLKAPPSEEKNVIFVKSVLKLPLQ